MRFIECKPLEEIADITRGVSWKSGEESSEKSFENIRAYKIPHIIKFKKYVSEEEPLYIKKYEKHEGKLLNYDDILMITSNGNPDRVGNISLYKSEDMAVPASFLLRIRGKECVNQEYLYYFLSSNKAQSNITGSVAGSTGLRNINMISLRELEVPLPDLKEQKKIAEILSTVDEQIEQTDQLIEKTIELKKGLMQQLLTKGIGHTEFKQSDLGEIPVRWDVKVIPDLVTPEKNAIKIGPFGSQLKKELLVNKGYKVYGQENVIAKDFEKGNRFLTDEHFKSLKTSELKPGDFVITMMGTIGKCAIFPNDAVPGIMDSHLLRIRLNKELYINELLLHVINSDLVQKQLKNLSVGGIMAGLSSKTVKQILLPVPPIEEQNRIAEILSSVDEELEGYQEERAKYEELKKGLMQQLLTGKVRVEV